MTDSKPRLSDEELAARKRRDRNARASLAIEGMYPTPEQEALFEMFDRERLTDEECRAILIKRAKALADKQP
jgi:hypothetical protein